MLWSGRVIKMLSIVFSFLFATCVAVPTDRDGVKGINEFSLRLLNNIAVDRDENFVVSSLSVWNLFALLSEAASGSTFDELVMQLNLPKNYKETKDVYAKANNVLSKNDTGVVINHIGAAYVDSALKVHQDFISLASKSYNAIVREVDTTDLQNVADVINYDVCVATEGQIRDIVKKDALENVKMLLIDSVYFKADWTAAFDGQLTKEEAFYDDRGRKIGTVNMMYQKSVSPVAYVDEISAQLLELTYGTDKKYSMIFILPYEGISLKKMIDNLSMHPLIRVFDALEKAPRSEVDCYVPRFKIGSDLDLKQPLNYMGINDVFQADRASLPGISDTPLYVSKVLQKAQIEVTEEGTLAVASTVIQLEDRILGNRVEVNKPFVFVVVEKESSLILFSGVYSIPTVV